MLLFCTGGGLDLSAIQERLSGLPGFEEMSTRQMQAMRDALMAGQTRARERLRRELGGDNRSETMDDDSNDNDVEYEEPSKGDAEAEVKPWPLHGIQPYYNPYKSNTETRLCETSEEKEGSVEGSQDEYNKAVQVPLFTGSATGTVPSITASDTKHAPAGQISCCPLFVVDKSHWGRYSSGGRLLIELPKMFTSLYKQVKLRKLEDGCIFYYVIRMKLSFTLHYFVIIW
jgi:hypothetical protein